MDSNSTDIKEKSLIKKILLNILVVFLIIVLIITGFYLYSRYIGTKGLKVNEIGLKTNITDNFDGLKIVHISDINYGSTIDLEYINNLVEKINEVKPDIVVFTGDLIAHGYKISTEELDGLTKSLNGITSTIGKYAITGVSDNIYENYNILLENIGFKNISNTYELIYKENLNYIMISGISTLSDNIGTDYKLASYYEYINNNKDNLPIYNILLIHEPDTLNNINIDDFDLILGGHSLNGQINLPFIGGIIKLDNAKEYDNLSYKINNTNIYISNGIGTSDLKLRFNNRPSFNFYRIKADN